MSQIRVQVLDRQAQRNEREVTTGTTAGELFPGDRDVVVARVNGELRDLSWVVADGDEVEPVPADSPTGRSVIRHSSAHVLAQAVQQAFPEAKLGIGPPIENGFYDDFQVDRAFTPEDLKADRVADARHRQAGPAVRPPRGDRRRRPRRAGRRSRSSSS